MKPKHFTGDVQTFIGEQISAIHILIKRGPHYSDKHDIYERIKHIYANGFDHGFGEGSYEGERRGIDFEQTKQAQHSGENTYSFMNNISRKVTNLERTIELLQQLKEAAIEWSKGKKIDESKD